MKKLLMLFVAATLLVTVVCTAVQEDEPVSEAEPVAEAEEMTEEQMNRYLLPGSDGNCRIKSRYHGTVTFRRANIIDVQTFKDTSPYDVVFCRNVLIYFSENALRIAIENFADVLRPGGVLFLGPSESIIGMSSRFETIRQIGRASCRERV